MHVHVHVYTQTLTPTRTLTLTIDEPRGVESLQAGGVHAVHEPTRRVPQACGPRRVARVIQGLIQTDRQFGRETHSELRPYHRRRRLVTRLVSRTAVAQQFERA